MSGSRPLWEICFTVAQMVCFLYLSYDRVISSVSNGDAQPHPFGVASEPLTDRENVDSHYNAKSDRQTSKK